MNSRGKKRPGVCHPRREIFAQCCGELMPDWHHAQRKPAFPAGVATCYDLQHFATAAMNIVVAIVLLALLTTLVAFDSGDPRA